MDEKNNVLHFIFICYAIISIILTIYWQYYKDNNWYEYVMGGSNIVLSILIIIVVSFFLVKNNISRKTDADNLYISYEEIDDMISEEIEPEKMEKSIDEISNLRKENCISEDKSTDKNTSEILKSLELEEKCIPEAGLNYASQNIYSETECVDTVEEKDLNVRDNVNHEYEIREVNDNRWNNHGMSSFAPNNNRIYTREAHLVYR